MWILLPAFLCNSVLATLLLKCRLILEVKMDIVQSFVAFNIFFGFKNCSSHAAVQHYHYGLPCRRVPPLGEKVACGLLRPLQLYTYLHFYFRRHRPFTAQMLPVRAHTTNISISALPAAASPASIYKPRCGQMYCRLPAVSPWEKLDRSCVISCQSSAHTFRL